MRLSFVVAGLVCSAAFAQVKLTQSPGRIAVTVDGKPFTEFIVAQDYSKPYLYPLLSASGKDVTRKFPMELVEGEERDHPHQRSAWFAHGDVNGYDFWGNEASQKGSTPNGKGKILLRKLVDLKDGKKSGSLEAIFDWQTWNGDPMLTENRKMVFYSGPQIRMIDFDITLSPVVKVTFGDTKEGTFALRLATSMDEAHGGKMTNAEGAETEKNVWGKQSPWVDYCGDVEGEKLGVAILDHPSNPRHPTYWHSRAYGLFAANIFGVRDFTGDKSRDGSLTLDVGQTLRFRYRVIIHPGDTAGAGIAKLYKDFARTK